MSTVANLIDSKGHDVLTVHPGLPVREAVAEIKIKNLESYISGSMEPVRFIHLFNKDFSC